MRFLSRPTEPSPTDPSPLVPSSTVPSPTVPDPAAPTGLHAPLAHLVAVELDGWPAGDDCIAADPVWATGVAAARERIVTDPHLWDGPAAMVHSIAVADGTVTVQWWPSSFAELAYRVERAGSVPTPPAWSPSWTVGLGMFVWARCTDGWVAARRASSLDAAGRWMCSATESVDVTELRPGPTATRRAATVAVALDRVASRSVAEELGVTPTPGSVRPWRVQQVWDREPGGGGWCTRLYVCCDLDVTLHELRAAWREAPDGWESDALAVVPTVSGPWLSGLLYPDGATPS